MTNLLYSKFKASVNSSLRWIILLMLFATFFLAFSILTYFDVITVFEKVNKDVSLQLYFACICEIGVIVGALVVLIPYIHDYKLIKSETYITINAIVSRFDFYWSGYEPMERIWFPVFEDINSGKTLKISVDEKVEVGDRYSIVCLPKTKITVLKKVNN